MEQERTAPWRVLVACVASLALAAALVPAAAIGPLQLAWADDEAQSLPTTTTASYTTSDGTAYTGVYVLGNSSGTTTYESGTLSAGTYVLDGDVKVEGTLTVSGGSTSTCEVTIDLNGYTISYAGTSTTEPTILATQYSGTVNTTSGSDEGYYGCTLTIKDTSSGGAGMITGSNSSGGVVNCVSDSANGTTEDGGRVYLNLAGGTIGGNDSGYGIYIGRYCTFKMTGGAVSDNYNTGVYNYSSPAVLSISGGTISGNGDPSKSKGGGVYVYNAGELTMSGGTISGNSASYGGGVCVNGNGSGTFTMSGGTISDNTATKYSGGVECTKNTFTMSGGTISCNEAGTYAGGVRVYNCTSASISGGTISCNEAGTYAGGVYVYYKSTFTMNAGTISGNEAGTIGGGVYVYGTSSSSACTFTATGGTLANNAADSYAADVYCASYGSLSLSGLNSNTVYKGDGKGKTVDGWYEDTSSARYEATSSKTAVTSFASGTAYALIAAYSNTCAYGEPVWTWKLGDDGTYTATATFTCTTCSGDDAHSQTVTDGEVEDNDDGTYTAEVSFCGDLFSDTIEVDFLGGSLRYSVSSEDASSYADAAKSTDLRLGFTYQLPVDSSTGELSASDVTIYYAVGTDESAVTAVSSYTDSGVYKGTKKRLYDESEDVSGVYATYLSNVVITSIGAAWYASEVYVRVWVVYTDSSGDTVVLDSATVHRSVGDVCEGIAESYDARVAALEADSSADVSGYATAAEDAYATALCAAYYGSQKKALYENAPTSTSTTTTDES